MNNPDTGNQILASTVTSASPDSNCPAGSTDPRCTATVTVSQLTIDSAVQHRHRPRPAGWWSTPPRSTNTGQTPYYGISVELRRTGNTDGQTTGNGNQTATSGTLSVGTTGAVWTGDVPVGGTVTITGSVTVDNPYTGSQSSLIADAHHRAGQQLPGHGSTDPRCTPPASPC